MTQDHYRSYERYDVLWQGIPVIVYYKSPYINVPIDQFGHTIAHLVIRSKNRQPLPISKTGYKSHFVAEAHIDTLGGPVQYGRTWLDQESKSREWQDYIARSSQLSLFDRREPSP